MAVGKEPLDYPIGPGDVIEISVPSMDELKDRTVRVSGTGDIELPLIGTLAVGGLDEAQLTDKLKQAVSKYMYEPQVEVFIREYHSRQIAVVGSVRAPGLITLQASGETILDAIAKAGGMTGDAADEIVILPQVADGPTRLQQVAQSFIQESDPNKPVASPGKPDTAQNTPAAPRDSDILPAPTLADIEASINNGPAVVIPLKNTAFTGNVNYVNLPTEPGDVIVVPGGGNVMVTGWVYRPGFFQVGSGLTVLGAVGSAGGAMYAADPTSANLIRSDSTGNKVAIPVNLTRIAKGQDPDIPVRANDVIDVPYSDVRIGPYVVYNILSKMSVPIPAY
jgi:polysaccharide export outer membrane protein